MLNLNEAPIKVSVCKTLSTLIPKILSTMTANQNKTIPDAVAPSSTSTIKAASPESRRSFPGGSGIAANSNLIEKSGNKSKKYMGARRSCAWIHFPPNAGSSSKYSPACPSDVGVLKKLMIDSKEAHQRDTENIERLRTKCVRLENELEFANRNFAQLH